MEIIFGSNPHFFNSNTRTYNTNVRCAWPIKCYMFINVLINRSIQLKAYAMLFLLGSRENRTIMYFLRLNHTQKARKIKSRNKSIASLFATVVIDEFRNWTIAAASIQSKSKARGLLPTYAFVIVWLWPRLRLLLLIFIEAKAKSYEIKLTAVILMQVYTF